MKKSWLKTTATYTMVGAGHEKGMRRGFANLTEDLTADQVTEFGNILAELTGDTVEKVVLNDTKVIAA
ncbi:hypothetical protein [Fructilactobacillus cliffordii]|uniref:DUF1659 domain-containing protein n=1 Tax=Fructilactobacillus cliffordii TaxID=2940299 RepID=A0A9Q8ZPK1_9LACO|nr:hypothetical protein [Fructilactobacillus cliffordii]USS86139.1 hypothetical protein M3M38_05430 [Fructilactobacillus cliffordii]USS89215.1 hypothetical protein M3M40_07020 [Fructilactobacillus cliffordii]